MVVEHTGNQPGLSYYRLIADGDGVSLAALVTASASTTKPTQSRTKPPSPEGFEGRLVCQARIGGSFHTIRVDGTDLQRIASDIDRVWSQSGDQMVLVRRNNDHCEIYDMDNDRRNPRPLFGCELDGLHMDYTFNDDGALSWTLLSGARSTTERRT